MDTDKNQNILEKQLKALSQKVRVDILKKLKYSSTPLSFSKLQKEIFGTDLSSGNLSFHLNTLKKSDLIISLEDGYSITYLGEQIIERILSIEQILNKKNKALMIRTSKYSKEVFDIKKIEEYLVREGELERYLAKQIAHEVEERLSRTNIEYMTAPLMREYINAILLENGLEEVRHKLTRLGTPPFEAFKLFNSKNSEITPEEFIKKLGSDVSEQFLLLNLLPKNLADLYLTGEIALLHLNYWGLRPLSLYINSKTLINYLSKIYSNEPQRIKNATEYTSLIMNFLDLLQKLKQFYSEDLLLSDFNTQFIPYLEFPEIQSSNYNFFTSQILVFNTLYNDGKSHLSLEFNYNEKSSEEFLNQIKLDKIFLNSLKKQKNNHIKPLLIFECSKIFSSDLSSFIIKNLLSNDNKDQLIIYNKDYSSLLNSSLIQIQNPKNDIVILDKILVNLHLISVEAKQNDDLFFDLLQHKLNSVFELFKFKESLVQKKLNSLKQWESIATRIYNKSSIEIFKDAIKSISFFGLNEAILNHCGIELDRTENSEDFALKILILMRKIIDEKNQAENSNYILSQPHKDTYLKDCWYNNMVKTNPKINAYSTRIIRRESNLSLLRRITLIKKFDEIFNGGTLFIEKKPKEMSFQKFIQTLFHSKIGTISLSECLI
ncbi:MAG: anaerobic ribonucleoside-triphosphate reductase [Candidatus Hermodarchaeota archaeon]